MRNNGGVWYFKEAKLPAGWPEFTPVGQIQIKQYPAYREAIITTDQTDASPNAMFRPLFEHISKNDIAMTAPVDVTYTQTDGHPQMRSMSFLYDIPDRGPTGEAGAVQVRDVPPAEVISIGSRGGYNDSTLTRGLAKLHAWLAEHPAYEAAGPPRYLGYNSPFIPYFWKYSEVQIPIRKRK
ncbi:MAG: heme-binding protein [Phycisphaeraceae bacterium]|nr:heme-binding protein [Phycisphaeraceae bacterium]